MYLSIDLDMDPLVLGIDLDNLADATVHPSVLHIVVDHHDLCADLQVQRSVMRDHVIRELSTPVLVEAV